MKKIVLIFAAMMMLAGCRQEPAVEMDNSLLVIAPYRHAGTWVFDEPSRGLRREPFVEGIPQMVDRLVADIPNAAQGFRLLFSTQEFPGYTHTLVWKRKDFTGNWYYCPQFDAEGWLCPALFKFFKAAPKTIFIKAESRL